MEIFSVIPMDEYEEYRTRMMSEFKLLMVCQGEATEGLVRKRRNLAQKIIIWDVINETYDWDWIIERYK